MPKKNKIESRMGESEEERETVRALGGEKWRGECLAKCYVPQGKKKTTVPRPSVKERGQEQTQPERREKITVRGVCGRT